MLEIFWLFWDWQMQRKIDLRFKSIIDYFIFFYIEISVATTLAILFMDSTNILVSESL